MRVLAALRTLANEVAWLLDARRATHEEDSCGIDLVAITDAGDLHLQVKSSRPRPRQAWKYRLRGIGLVVVRGSNSQEGVRLRVLHQLRLLRGEDVGGDRTLGQRMVDVERKD